MNRAFLPPALRRRTVRCLGALGTAVGATAIGVLAAGAALLVSAWRMAMLVVAVALGGCATLPGPTAPPASSVALGPADVGSTPLATMASAAAPFDGSGRAGFRWLVDGPEALGARIALVRAAERAVDVQVYLIGDDATGHGFLLELERAAARGVRVRLLLDDLHAGALEPRLARLAAARHAEVRLFNPLPARGGGPVGRVARSLHESARIHRRMHDKLFVADSSVAIVGGRNVADAYFERAAADHFIDFDVLTAGASVPPLLASFDAFWNHPAAWPIGTLLGVAPAHARAETGPSWPASRVAADIAAGRLALQPAHFTLLADGPDKLRVDRAARDGIRRSHGGTVAAGHRALLDAAADDVLLVSPYVVPGAAGVAAMAALRRRGVAVAVLTNSLGSTDEPLAHFGYARYREGLLDAGVALHELVVAGAPREDLAVGASAALAGSQARLHGKLSVVDRRSVFVGSMNLDPRSERWNTELGLVLESPALAAEVLAAVDRHLRDGCWRVERRGHDRALTWRRPRDGTTVDVEPGSRSRGHLRARLLLVALGEEML